MYILGLEVVIPRSSCISPDSKQLSRGVHVYLQARGSYPDELMYIFRPEARGVHVYPQTRSSYPEEFMSISRLEAVIPRSSCLSPDSKQLSRGVHVPRLEAVIPRSSCLSSDSKQLLSVFPEFKR